MQEAIDKKLDVTAFEEASKLLGARIDGIEAGLSTLENGAVKENTEAIKLLWTLSKHCRQQTQTLLQH